MTVRHTKSIKLCDYRHMYGHHKLALLMQPKYAGMVRTEQFQLDNDVNARKSGGWLFSNENYELRRSASALHLKPRYEWNCMYMDLPNLS